MSTELLLEVVAVKVDGVSMVTVSPVEELFATTTLFTMWPMLIAPVTPVALWFVRFTTSVIVSPIEHPSGML